MIILYIIKSLNKNYHYVGITNNLKRRVKQHNAGLNTSTKSYRPFKIVHTEIFSNYKEARIREKFLKSGPGRKFIRETI
ncbi:MAG: endonuclease [Candidatus Portnoybacteria bacterium CG10_big_fil_rev_8_21_14_0_10_44_7]|uniref:Endonuclease n=1 Tax=Candidatus Portnoybacteria bacterium CG10_big_fil_rev_8_21_14_0_10_44_7 TaxID=1974816 RepID=A0A2M8KIN1_9BACT|nr:MAG: endonuclease [Candidatus Portnoybacteria bacterium CG10_big_fil_rev_8_21_14_0_10_44_7]